MSRLKVLCRVASLVYVFLLSAVIVVVDENVVVVVVVVKDDCSVVVVVVVVVVGNDSGSGGMCGGWSNSIDLHWGAGSLGDEGMPSAEKR